MPLNQTVTVVSGAYRSSVMKGGVRYLSLTTPNPITTVSATGTLRFSVQAGATYTDLQTSGGTAISIVCASGAAEHFTLSDQLTKSLSGASGWRITITKTGSGETVVQTQDTEFVFAFGKYS